MTWTEIGLWLLLLYGAFLGSLKRYAPVSEELVTIGFDALCFALLGYVVVRRLLRSRKIPFSPLTPLLLLFMAFALITILNPVLTSWTRGLLGWRFLASGLLFHFLGFYAFDDVRRLRRFFTIFWLVAGIVAVYGLVQLVRGYTAVELAWISDLAATMRIAGTGRYRLMATMGSAVDLGFFISLAMTSLVGVVITTRRLKTSYLLLLGLMAITLIFTFVRAAWAAVFMSVMYMMMVNLWHIKRFRPLFPLLGIFVASAPILLLFTAGPIATYFDNPALQERVASLSDPLADKSMLDRFDRWSTVWTLVREYPLGVGVGMTGAATLRYPDDPGPVGATVDNTYLKILVETGWVGLTLFILLLMATLIKGGRIYKKLTKPYQCYALPLLGAFVAFVVILAFGEYIELNPGRTIVWILTGFLFSLPRLQYAGKDSLTP